MGRAPPIVVLENSPAILVRKHGAGAVLGALASLGYSTVWDCIPAGAIGAPHIRDRWFAVATLEPQPGLFATRAAQLRAFRVGCRRWVWPMANTNQKRLQGILPTGSAAAAASRSSPGLPPAVARMGRAHDGVSARMDRPRKSWEGDEPRLMVPRTKHRVPRLKALGNSIVPQVSEFIGLQIMTSIKQARAPGWEKCGCGNFFCPLHQMHAHDCDCL